MSTVKPITGRAAGELCRLLEERGISGEEYQTYLVENPNGLIGYLRNEQKRLIKSFVVDLDADPFVPPDCKIQDHRNGGLATVSQKRGKLCLNCDPVELYLSTSQQYGGTVVGNILWQELQNKPVVNANLLDALLLPKHQHLIPEDWKDKYSAPFFWGTIYRDESDDPFVRCLSWRVSGWRWYYLGVETPWDGSCPAILNATTSVP